MAPDLRKKIDAIREARLAKEEATQRQVIAQVRFPRLLNNHELQTIQCFLSIAARPGCAKARMGRHAAFIAMVFGMVPDIYLTFQMYLYVRPVST